MTVIKKHVLSSLLILSINLGITSLSWGMDPQEHEWKTTPPPYLSGDDEIEIPDDFWNNAFPTKKQKLEEIPQSSPTSQFSKSSNSNNFTIVTIPQQRGIWCRNLNYVCNDQHFDTLTWHVKSASEIKEITEKSELINFAKVRIEALYTKENELIQRTIYEPPVMFSSRTVEEEGQKFLSFSKIVGSDEKGRSVISRLLGQDIQENSDDSDFKKKYYHTEHTILEYVIGNSEWIKGIRYYDDSYNLSYLVFSICSYYDPCENCSQSLCRASLNNEYFSTSIKKKCNENKLPFTNDFGVFVNVSSVCAYNNSRNCLNETKSEIYMNSVPLREFHPFFAQMAIPISTKFELPSYVQPSVKLELFEEDKNKNLEELEKEEKYDELARILFSTLYNNFNSQEAKQKSREFSKPLLKLLNHSPSDQKEDILKKQTHFVRRFNQEKEDLKNKEYEDPNSVLNDLNQYTCTYDAYGKESREYRMVTLFQNAFDNKDQNKTERDKLTGKLLSSSTCTHKGEKISEEKNLAFLLKVFGWIFLNDGITNNFPVPNALKKLKRQSKKLIPDTDDNICARLEKFPQECKSLRLCLISKYLLKKFKEGTYSLKGSNYYRNAVPEQ